jgi:hypothetical protein
MYVPFLVHFYCLKLQPLLCRELLPTILALGILTVQALDTVPEHISRSIADVTFLAKQL